MSDGLVHRVREAAGEPEGALILLHGRGADEHDLVPMLDILDRERRLIGLTPGARCPVRPAGAGGTTSRARAPQTRRRSIPPIRG